MSTIIVPHMERKGMTKGAFGTQLTCPSLVTGLSGTAEACGASKWEFVEKAGPMRIRYRCKVCHKTLVYDFSGNPSHPYASYGKSKWRNIVDKWKETKGTHPLGI